MILTLNDLCGIWGAPVLAISGSTCQIPLGPVCTDSREISQGNFFVPLVGQNFDGHAFLDDVLDLGAQGVVVSKNHKKFANLLICNHNKKLFI